MIVSKVNSRRYNVRYCYLCQSQYYSDCATSMSSRCSWIELRLIGIFCGKNSTRHLYLRLTYFVRILPSDKLFRFISWSRSHSFLLYQPWGIDSCFVVCKKASRKHDRNEIKDLDIARVWHRVNMETAQASIASLLLLSLMSPSSASFQSPSSSFMSSTMPTMMVTTDFGFMNGTEDFTDDTPYSEAHYLTVLKAVQKWLLTAILVCTMLAMGAVITVNDFKETVSTITISKTIFLKITKLKTTFFFTQSHIFSS